MASSAENGIREKSKTWDELHWLEKARLSLAQAAGWFVASAILLFVIGMTLPRLNSLVEAVGLAPNIFVLCAAMLASMLVSWRSGKLAAERVGPILAVVGIGAIVAQANSWEPFSSERPGEYRSITDRQGKLIEMWQACVYDDDAEKCSQAQSEEEQLDHLQRRREALLR